jgi:hypothetical protein
LQELLFRVFNEVGDAAAAPRAFELLRQTGYEGINIRPSQAGARNIDDMAL